MYYQKLAIGIVSFALIATVLDAAHRSWNTEAREAFHYTFAKDNALDVDNVDGTIQVVGDNGNTIRVEGEEIIRAEDQRALDRAKRDVKLDVNERDGVAQLYVNGPFRSNNHGSDDHGFHIHFDDHEYEVTYNFTIRVPRETALRLRTVNGDVKTEDTRGKFDVHGVNGSVAMNAIAGSGTLRTVNGRASVSFRENPRAPSDFQTVNGTIEASFPSNLSADIRLKTLNGRAYTDFEATALPASTVEVADRSRGRLVYKFNRRTSVRIGSGGPELNFETVNGDIRIRKETLK
jgi:DUF4097 and DUF4098 domain-containing protein YvlB